MTRTQSAIHSPRLTIDIARLITTQEQRHARHLIRDTPSLQWIQLSNLSLRPSPPRKLIHQRRHARLYDSRTQRIHSDSRARELIRHCLRQRNHTRLGRAVIRRPRITAQTRAACSRHDAAARVRLVGGRLAHGGGCEFRAQEHGQQVDAHHVQERGGVDVPEGRHAVDAGVRKHDVESAVGGDGVRAECFDGGFRGAVEGVCFDGDGRVEGLELAFVCLEIRDVQIRDV